jgi:UDP-N-acetylglucosamine 2-epimerase (non-hydrolysing)
MQPDRGAPVGAAASSSAAGAVEQQAIAVVVGTRPEAIKMAPVVLALRRSRFRTVLISSAQHTDMLGQALAGFGLVPDVDLALLRPEGGLAEFLATALEPLARTLREIGPALTLVQGDTMTVLAAAQASFFEGIPVGHVEGGLRSHDMDSPFPEEAIRRMVGLLASYHFAPTVRAQRNLIAEGIAPECVWMTGNTIEDARQQLRADEARTPDVRALDFQATRVVLVTAHRRENHGQPMRQICAAIRDLLSRFPDVQVLFPVHPSPAVHALVHSELAGEPRVRLTAPLPYHDLLYVLRHCELVLTDSGGIQEEAPAFNRPVLVLRRVTERPELVESGNGALVGTDRTAIVAAASRLLTDDAAYRAMAAAPNPFGDGCAAERIVTIVSEQLDRRRALRVV